MTGIKNLHNRERFIEMLSASISRENLWGNIDVISRDQTSGLLLVLRDQYALPNLVSSEMIYESYEDAMTELGQHLDD